MPYLSWDEWGNWTTDSVVKYGVYGESAVVPAFTVARNPDGLSPVQGAAIWCQYATAWGGLIDYAALAPSDIVLVTAASSSAALGGLQIAKRVGATVIAATRKADKADFLREAGADHVVATEEEDLARCVKEITGGRGFRSRTGRIRGGGRWARGRGGRGCLRSARRRPGRGPRRGAGPGSAGPPAGPIR